MVLPIHEGKGVGPRVLSTGSSRLEMVVDREVRNESDFGSSFSTRLGTDQLHCSCNPNDEM